MEDDMNSDDSCKPQTDKTHFAEQENATDMSRHQPFGIHGGTICKGIAWTSEFTPLKINMEPQNNWLVEEIHLPGDHCGVGSGTFKTQRQ